MDLFQDTHFYYKVYDLSLIEFAFIFIGYYSKYF